MNNFDHIPASFNKISWRLVIVVAAFGNTSAHSQASDTAIVGVHYTCDSFLPAGTRTSDPKSGWTLADLTRFALCNNPQQRAARANSQLEDLQVDVAKSAYWPSVGLTVSKNHAVSTGNTITFDSSGPNTLVDVKNRVKSSASTTMLQLNHTLWDFGAREANVKKVMQQRIAANASAQLIQQMLTAQVVQAYLAVLAAAESPRDGPLAQGEQLARAQLASLLGLELDSHLKLAPITNYQFEKPEEWRTWWELAKTRQDLVAAKAHIAEDEEALKAAKAAMLGSIAVSWSIAPGYSTVIGRNNTEIASLAYTVPLLNGAVSSTSVDSSVARLAAHQADAEAAAQAAQIEVYKAWDVYRQAYQIVQRYSADARDADPLKDKAITALVHARIGLLQSIGWLTPSVL